MTQIIDFRNAKFQGQTKNGWPHGLGIMIDYNNIFTLAQWQNGQINGNCLIVFGDSKIFYGQIRNKIPIGVCTYHFKDKCQVFCRFKSQTNQHYNNSSVNRLKNDKLVALLPTFNIIINVEGDDEQQLQITQQKNYNEGDFRSLKNILQNMLNFNFKNQELENLLSLEKFIKRYFYTTQQHKGFLDILTTISPEGARQLFISIRNRLQPSSLGIKIQNCMQNPNTLTNSHNDGNSYIVKALGFFSRQGILQYGLKNIKTMIKGNVKQEAIYSNQKTIIRYQNAQNRPKACFLNLVNEFKRSVNFQNSFLSVKYLLQIQEECLNINFNIKQTETKRYAQLVLQNPKQLTIQEKQTIEEGRLRKLNKGSILKNGKQLSTPNPYKKNIEQYQKKHEQLQKTKQDIYRSVSKKKINEVRSSSPLNYSEKNINNFIEKDLKPSELTNIKPLSQIHKNSPDKSFYNSIANNSVQNLNVRDIQGYKYQIKVNYPQQKPSAQSSYEKNKNYGHFQQKFSNSSYFKNLQGRRRLYQESRLVQLPLQQKTNYQYGNQSKRNTPIKKKFSYLPQQNYADSRQKTNYIRSDTSKYSPYKYPQSQQTGKLGRRVIKKHPEDNLSPSKFNNIKKQNSEYRSIHNPIIVPQLKIYNYKPEDSYNNKFQQQDEDGPKRRHHLKYQADVKQLPRTPLRTQKYRRQYLNQASPIRKLGSQMDIGSKNKYEQQIIMDPGLNYAKQQPQNRYGASNEYGQSKYFDRNRERNQKSKSPLQKRKRILNQNPFQN